jgi:hypothetical protein
MYPNQYHPQYSQQMYDPYFGEDQEYEENPRELTGRQIRRSRRGDLRRQRRENERQI